MRSIVFICAGLLAVSVEPLLLERGISLDPKTVEAHIVKHPIPGSDSTM